MSRDHCRCADCGTIIKAQRGSYPLCADCKLMQQEAEETVNAALAGVLAAA